MLELQGKGNVFPSLDTKKGFFKIVIQNRNFGIKKCKVVAAKIK